MIKEKLKKLVLSNILIILILVFAIVLYTHFMLHNTLSPDEALYAWNAMQLYEEPFLIFSEQIWQDASLFYVTVGIFDVFLPQEFAARLVPVLFALFGIFMIYLLGNELKNKNMGLLAALFLTLNPWYWMMSNRILLDVPLTAMIILNCYFLVKFCKSYENKFLFLSGISFILVLRNNTPIGSTLGSFLSVTSPVPILELFFSIVANFISSNSLPFNPGLF